MALCQALGDGARDHTHTHAHSLSYHVHTSLALLDLPNYVAQVQDSLRHKLDLVLSLPLLWASLNTNDFQVSQ